MQTADILQGHLTDFQITFQFQVCGWMCCKKDVTQLQESATPVKDLFRSPQHQVQVTSLTRLLQNLDFISSSPVLDRCKCLRSGAASILSILQFPNLVFNHLCEVPSVEVCVSVIQD